MQTDEKIILVSNDKFLKNSCRNLLRSLPHPNMIINSINDITEISKIDCALMIIDIAKSDIQLDNVIERTAPMLLILIHDFPSLEITPDIYSRIYEDFSKPVDYQKLLRKIQQALQLKSLQERQDLLQEKVITLSRRISENHEKLRTSTSRLKYSEQQLKLIKFAIEKCTECVIIADASGTIHYANSAFQSITGYDQNEATFKMSLLQSCKNSNTSPCSKKQDQCPHNTTSCHEIWNILKKGESWHGSFNSCKKDGSLYIEENIISPVKDEFGKITHFICVKRDITKQKRLESIAEAINLMDNIGYIFSGIRHEIGNPFNSLKMTITVLQKNWQQYSADTIHEFFQRALSEISRVEYLLKALKNFSLFEHLNTEKIEIAEYIDNFITLIKKDFDKKGILIRRELSQDAKTLLADSRALQQVLLNLFTNAADALKDRKNPTIVIVTTKSPGLVQLKVIDNGWGINQEQQKNLFKPFFTSKPTGSGLGLVIVKKMLSLMNGTIEVSSKKNVETVVIISLPES